MIALIVIVLIIAVVLFVRIGIWVQLSAGELSIKLGIQGIYFDLKKKDRKSKKQKKAATAETDEVTEAKKGQKRDIKELVGIILNALKRIPRLTKGIHIVKLYADVRLVGGDAAKTAMLYGKATSLLYTAYPYICKLFTVKKFNVDIAPDFVGEKSSFSGEVKLTSCIGVFIAVGVPILYEFIRYMFKETKNNKNINNESGGKYERECETAVN